MTKQKDFARTTRIAVWKQQRIELIATLSIIARKSMTEHELC